MSKSVFRKCKSHQECRCVAGDGGMFEIVECPWCGYQVSTSNPYRWCANCYTLFRLDDGLVHFGKRIPATVGEAWAIAIAKSGGARIGKTNE